MLRSLKTKVIKKERSVPHSKCHTQGIVNLIKTLQKRGVAVYMISGGFREDIMPIAKYLGVPKENVFANRMNWCVACTGARWCTAGFSQLSTGDLA